MKGTQLFQIIFKLNEFESNQCQFTNSVKSNEKKKMKREELKNRRE